MDRHKLHHGIVKVIQITDTHLFADDKLQLFGITSNHTFHTVIEKILTEDIADTNFIFLTGDVSQDETEQSYIKIRDSLENLSIPVYWIPGNHDHIFNMEAVFKTSKYFFNDRTLSLLNWNFIFLNTKLDDNPYGYLSQSEMLILKQEIEKAKLKDKRLAIVMHHHPIEVNTPLVDNYILKNREEFWSIVEGSNVELIICGHVHGDYTLKYKSIKIEASPSTCLQWKHGTKDLSLDSRIGYKIYHFDNSMYRSIAKMW